MLIECCGNKKYNFLLSCQTVISENVDMPYPHSNTIDLSTALFAVLSDV